MHAPNSLRTFFSTSFVLGLSLLQGCIAILASRYILILSMQRLVYPFYTTMFHANAVLWYLSISTSFISCTLDIKYEIMRRREFFTPKIYTLYVVGESFNSSSNGCSIEGLKCPQ